MRRARLSLVACLLSLCAVGSADDCGQRLVYQVRDPRVDVVAKVVARGPRRQLVLANGSDFTAPCSGGTLGGWWLEHEVQGTVLCEEAHAGAPGTFLQSRRAPAGCPPCAPQVDATVARNGYFSSLAALCVLTAEGQPRRPARVLVIGLGAGVLPSWLAAHTDAAVDVVDVAQAVLDVSPCFGVEAGPRLALHAADGRRFLAGATAAAYDTIVVDAFDGSAAMPPCLRSVEFFELAAAKLGDGGVLLLNLLTCASDRGGGEDCGRFSASVVASAQQAFPVTYLAEAPGAMGSQAVLLARKRGTGIEDSGGRAPGGAVRGWFKAAAVRKLTRQEAGLATHDAAC